MTGLLDTVRGWFGGRGNGPQASANTITTSQELQDVLLSGGSNSLAGVQVTAETAMMVAAVSAAVGIIAESVAQLPLVIYRRNPSGGKDRDAVHPLWPLLHDKPNEWQSSFEFREMLTLHLCLWGNAYAFKNQVTTGARPRVTELVPIHPDRVRVEQDEAYRVTYRVAMPGGEQVILPRERIFHLRDRSTDGYRGISRLKMGRDSIGLSMVAERWGAQLFGNGARPSGILHTDKSLTTEQMKVIKDSWRAAHGGENALGTAVLDGGLDWKALVMSNEDAQFLETRKFQIAEISRLYRVPPHMLGDLERATFSNIEHQSLEFVKFSLMPWLRRWETAVNTQLIGPETSVFAEFLVEGLLRGDVKSRYEAYQIAIMNGWMNPNEVRERENLNPREGGDEYRPAASMYGDQGGGNEPAPATED